MFYWNIIFVRRDLRYVGPLIILGPILVVAGVGLVVCSMELIIRLTRQIKRVMDPNLLKTNNLHEVKHWVEPGLYMVGLLDSNLIKYVQTLNWHLLDTLIMIIKMVTLQARFGTILMWLLQLNIPGTRGGPGGRDRTLAVKRRKHAKISFFSVKK